VTRRLVQPVSLELSVVRGPWGQLRVVDQDGIPVLAHPDPVTALERAYLVRACAELRAAVAPLVWRLERIEIDHGIPIMGRDDSKIATAWLALHRASPPADEYRAAATASGQGELQFEDAA
jgi:hypothetical protein